MKENLENRIKSLVQGGQTDQAQREIILAVANKEDSIFALVEAAKMIVETGRNPQAIEDAVVL